MKKKTSLFESTIDLVLAGYDVDEKGKLVAKNPAKIAESDALFHRDFLEKARKIWDEKEAAVAESLAGDASQIGVEETAGDPSKTSTELGQPKSDDDSEEESELPESADFAALFGDDLTETNFDEIFEFSNIEGDGNPVDGHEGGEGEMGAEGGEGDDGFASLHSDDDSLGNAPEGADAGMDSVEPAGMDDGSAGGIDQDVGMGDAGGDSDMISLADIGLGDFDFDLGGASESPVGDDAGLGDSMSAAPDQGGEMGGSGIGGEDNGDLMGEPVEDPAGGGMGSEMGGEMGGAHEPGHEEDENKMPFEAKKPTGKKMNVVPSGKPKAGKARPGLPSKR